MTLQRISYFPGISKQMWLCHFKLLISEADLQHLYHYRPGCIFLLILSDTMFFGFLIFIFFFELEINQLIFGTTNSLLALFLCWWKQPIKIRIFFLYMRQLYSFAFQQITPQLRITFPLFFLPLATAFCYYFYPLMFPESLFC